MNKKHQITKIRTGRNIEIQSDMDFASHYEFFKMNDIKDISSSKPPFGRYRDRRSADMLHAKYASETTKKLNFTLFKRL